MSTPKQKGHSSNNFFYDVDLTEYPYSPLYTPKISPQRTIVYKDGTEYPSIDSARLLPVMVSKLFVKDLKYYFYLLSELVSNDKPITVPMTELRGLFKETYTAQVFAGFDRLCAAGLIYKQPNKRSTYFVNPAYAWKGERSQYLDIDKLPLVSS